jgi:hypothetical protein
MGGVFRMVSLRIGNYKMVGNDEAVVDGKIRKLNTLGGRFQEVLGYANPADRPEINGKKVEIDGNIVIYRGV